MSAVGLSIITVNLNNREGLAMTLKSVLGQSYTNYEFLVIDGGSGDGSVDCIRNVAASLTYWVSEPDRGIYHAMNKGIAQATGTYCLFLNSGDWLVDNKVLERVFSTNPAAADVVIGRCRISENNQPVFITNPPVDLTLQSFIRNTLPHQATFIKTALFDRFGPYDETYRINADYDFWIRAIILGNCSTVGLDVIVADYNLAGISSRIAENPAVHAEIPRILSAYFPERILQDYRNWWTEKPDKVYFDWMKSKKIVYGTTKLLYRIAKRLNKVLGEFGRKNVDHAPAE